MPYYILTVDNDNINQVDVLDKKPDGDNDFWLYAKDDEFDDITFHTPTDQVKMKGEEFFKAAGLKEISNSGLEKEQALMSFVATTNIERLKEIFSNPNKSQKAGQGEDGKKAAQATLTNRGSSPPSFAQPKYEYNKLKPETKRAFEILESGMKDSGKYLENMLQGRSIKEIFDIPYEKPDEEVLNQYIRSRFVVKTRDGSFKRVELNDLENPNLIFVETQNPSVSRNCYDLQDIMPLKNGPLCKMITARKQRKMFNDEKIQARAASDMRYELDEEVEKRITAQTNVLERNTARLDETQKGKIGTKLERFFSIPHKWKSEVARENLLKDPEYIKALNKGDKEKCESMERWAAIKNFGKKTLVGAANVLTFNMDIKPFVPDKALDWFEKHPKTKKAIKIAGKVAKYGVILGAVTGVTLLTLGAAGPAAVGAAILGGAITSPVGAAAASAALGSLICLGVPSVVTATYSSVLQNKLDPIGRDDIAVLSSTNKSDTGKVQGYQPDRGKELIIKFEGDVPSISVMLPSNLYNARLCKNGELVKKPMEHFKDFSEEEFGILLAGVRLELRKRFNNDSQKNDLIEDCCNALKSVRNTQLEQQQRQQHSTTQR